jgi:hypothetical protein
MELLEILNVHTLIEKSQVNTLSGMRNYYHLNNPQSQIMSDVYWIEGVGCTEGAFYTAQNTPGYDNVNLTVCAYQDSVQIFHYGGGIPCDSNLVSVQSTEIFGYNILLYPNPATNSLTFVIPEEYVKQHCRLIISDMLGQEVYSCVVRGNNIKVNTETINAGMYFYSLRKDSIIKAKGKFVKQL